MKTYVIGVGMTKFEKPGAREWDYPDMAVEAGTKALDDAGVPYDRIEQAGANVARVFTRTFGVSGRRRAAR